VQEKILGGFF